jgi:hypothetical protein
MSANGRKLALLTEEMFRVFDTNGSVRLVAMGQFMDKGTHFKYSHQGGEMNLQVPLPAEKFEINKFSCVAVSNEYLAIGSKGRMMIFVIDGEHAGRWVCDAIHDSTTWMEKLEFSADGGTLVALLRCESGRSSSFQSKALIYSTENIEKENIEREPPVPPLSEVAPTLKWDWEFDTPTSVGFSGDGMTIAISTTTDARGVAKIRLLKKVASEWKYLGSQSVPVFGSVERHGKGISGLALYFPPQAEANDTSFRHDESLALSIDSPYRYAPDCYRVLLSDDQQSFKLVPSDQIASGESKNFALAIWQEHGIVILLNNKGIYDFLISAAYFFTGRLSAITTGTGSGPHVLPLARKYPQELNNLNAVNMVFDNFTQKLFVLDHQVTILKGSL